MASMILAKQDYSLLKANTGGKMRIVFTLLILLLPISAIAKDPIPQSINKVNAYIKAINSVAKGVDPTKGTVIDRIIKVYKNPAEKQGYDFDKTLRLLLVGGINDRTLLTAISTTINPINQNIEEALSKKLITQQTYNLIKEADALKSVSALAESSDSELQQFVINALIECVDANASICSDKKLEKLLRKHETFAKITEYNQDSFAHNLGQIQFNQWGHIGLITSVDGREINTYSFFEEGNKEINFKINKDLFNRINKYNVLKLKERKLLLK